MAYEWRRRTTSTAPTTLRPVPRSPTASRGRTGRRPQSSAPALASSIAGLVWAALRARSPTTVRTPAICGLPTNPRHPLPANLHGFDDHGLLERLHPDRRSPHEYRDGCLGQGLRSAYTIQSAFTLEQQIGKYASVSVTYLNAQGQHQFLTRIFPSVGPNGNYRLRRASLPDSSRRIRSTTASTFVRRRASPSSAPTR